jgi:hypothetical protein
LLHFKPEDEFDRKLLLGIMPKLKYVAKDKNMSERIPQQYIDAKLSRTDVQSHSQSGLKSHRTQQLDLDIDLS